MPPKTEIVGVFDNDGWLCGWVKSELNDIMLSVRLECVGEIE